MNLHNGRYASKKLANLLVKLGLKKLQANMFFPSWQSKLEENIRRPATLRELKAFEQEIQSRKTRKRP